MTMLGKISITEFTPQTAKRGHDMTERKQKLRDEFEFQNKIELPQVIKDCKDKKSLKLKVIFKLNTDVENPTTYKKDLDNLLKVLLDILPEEMDATTQTERGLGIIQGNEDDRVREIYCRKDFVKNKKEEGILVEFYEFLE